MAALSESKMEIVKALVETAPDRVVGSLQEALSETSDQGALGGVRRLVEAEVADRSLRNQILLPIVPMCVGASPDERDLSFPARVLPLVWRGLRTVEPDSIEAFREAQEDYAEPHAYTPLFERLDRAAVEGIKARENPDFRAAAEICESAREGGADQLVACLQLAPIVRRASERLREWLAHPGGQTNAAARVAYKDAVNTSDDSGPRFFRMLAAQMPHPWMVLRVISAVMDKPTERYLADSELADFGEQVIEQIDAALKRIASFSVDQGPAAGREVAAVAALAIQQLQEIETNVDLDREHGWGRRIHKQRTDLAAIVERRLHEAEKISIEALLVEQTRQRPPRPVLHLDAPPQARLVQQAMTLLSFSQALQSCANYGGFSAARVRLVEKLGEHIDHYVDEVLDQIRVGEATDRDAVAAHLATAADFCRLIRDDKAGELIRRRAHAALNPEPAQAASA